MKDIILVLLKLHFALLWIKWTVPFSIIIVIIIIIIIIIIV